MIDLTDEQKSKYIEDGHHKTFELSFEARKIKLINDAMSSSSVFINGAADKWISSLWWARISSKIRAQMRIEEHDGIKYRYVILMNPQTNIGVKVCIGTDQYGLNTGTSSANPDANMVIYYISDLCYEYHHSSWTNEDTIQKQNGIGFEIGRQMADGSDFGGTFSVKYGYYKAINNFSGQNGENTYTEIIGGKYNGKKLTAITCIDEDADTWTWAFSDSTTATEHGDPLRYIACDLLNPLKNTDLHQNAVKLTEKLCSDDNLKFGSCNASIIDITSENVEAIKDDEISIKQTLEDYDGTEIATIPYGVFVIDKVKRKSGKPAAAITAYDKMVYFDTDVSDMFSLITFPMSFKVFRKLLCARCGVLQDDTALINDDIMIQQGVSGSVNGIDCLKAVCEANGVFGHIDRQGYMKYVQLKNDLNYTYPYYNPEGTEYEDYNITKIEKLTINGDNTVIHGAGLHSYTIDKNFLFNGMTADVLQTVCDNIFSTISIPVYTPFEADVPGLPFIEVGDKIKISTKYGDIESFVLQRTLNGIQSLKDSIIADGKENDTIDNTGLGYSVENLQNTMNNQNSTYDEKLKILESTIDSMASEISALKERVSTLENK